MIDNMDIQILTIDSTKLHVIAKPQSVACGSLWISVRANKTNTYMHRFDRESYQEVAIPPHSEVRIKSIDLEILYMDISRIDGSINVINPDDGSIKKRSNDPRRPIYHFSPVQGWLNDPNGLCRYNDRYHLFYQYNPTSQEWGNPYWGHASSKDLIHWMDMEISLIPQQEILGREDIRGGAYSGSAIVASGMMKIYFTRHIGDIHRTWCEEKTYTVDCEDEIHLLKEREVIHRAPDGLDQNFRDPKITKIGNTWYMLTGSRKVTTQTPCITLHTSEDLQSWTYQGIFFEESNPQYLQAECPDLFKINGHYILVVCYHNKIEPFGPKRRDVVYYIGQIQGFRFQAQHYGLLDYGKDFYAPQTFFGTDAPIMIGWNNDMAKNYIPTANGGNGTMSLPRELFLKQGFLHSFPITELNAIEMFIQQKTISNGAFTISSHGSYHFHADMKQVKTVEFKFAQSERGDIVVGYDGNQVKISIQNVPDSIKVNLQEIDVFCDRSIVEIFMNHGLFAFTRRFHAEHPVYNIAGTIQGNLSYRLGFMQSTQENPERSSV